MTFAEALHYIYNYLVTIYWSVNLENEFAILWSCAGNKVSKKWEILIDMILNIPSRNILPRGVTYVQKTRTNFGYLLKS